MRKIWIQDQDTLGQLKKHFCNQQGESKRGQIPPSRGGKYSSRQMDGEMPILGARLDWNGRMDMAEI